MNVTARSNPLRIAIADDHPLMRAALASALADLATDVQFLEAANHAATLAVIDALPGPDLLLMDLHMPGTDGIEGVRDVRNRAPHVPLAVVSADDDPAGGIYVPPRLVAHAGIVPATNGAPVSGLTSRQIDVVRLLARGLSNKAIARELGVSEGTVKVHLLAVFRVLDVRNRTAAVIAAQRFLR